MAGFALPSLLPAIRDPGLEFEKYANLLLALVSRRQLLTRVENRPFEITLDLTTACNLRCPYCAHGSKINWRPTTTMRTAEHDAILNFCGRQAFTGWYFSNGEPLLHKQFPEIMTHTEQFELFSVISTNLSMPLSTARIDAIISSGLDILCASIDGASAATYGKYRIGGNYDLVMENLARFIERKKALGAVRPYLEWRFLVFEHNQHEQAEVSRKAWEMGVDMLEFFHGSAPDSAPEGSVRRATIPISQPVISGPAIEWGNARMDTLLRRLLSRPVRSPPVAAGPAEFHHKCDWLYFGSMFYPQGSVGPCCVVGNEESDFGRVGDGRDYASVWNNENYAAARRIFSADDAPPHEVCSRCHNPDAQDYMFRLSLQAYLLNAPNWFLRILATDPERFFFPVDFALIPQVLAAVREHCPGETEPVSNTEKQRLRDYLGENSLAWQTVRSVLERSSPAAGGEKWQSSVAEDGDAEETAPPEDSRQTEAPAPDRERYRHAAELLAAGAAEQAVPVLLEMAQNDTGCWEVYEALATLVLENGDMEAAIELLEKAAKIDWKNPHLQYKLGELHAALGRNDKALEHFGQVLRKAPGDPSALYAARHAINAGGPLSAVSWSRLIADLQAGHLSRISELVAENEKLRARLGNRSRRN